MILTDTSNTVCDYIFVHLISVQSRHVNIIVSKIVHILIVCLAFGLGYNKQTKSNLRITGRF